jgi:hypothetical protein
LPLSDLWPRFGYPNDLLGMLAARSARVLEVPVRPVYADEESGIRAFHAASILALIARRYLKGAGASQVSDAAPPAEVVDAGLVDQE